MASTLAATWSSGSSDTSFSMPARDTGWSTTIAAVNTSPSMLVSLLLMPVPAPVAGARVQ
jgi:hypothetical protein